jgi:formylglycine-generating enzyme
MKLAFLSKGNAIPWYKVNPKDGSELVLVPGGWFWMGSGDEDPDAFGNEKPRHLHYVEPFYFGIVCVTVAQFKRFVRETSHSAGKDWQRDPGEHPVQYVMWRDAAAYCQWAGLRLPTEAEWELAARGYGALRYPWGNDWEWGGRQVCWGRQRGPKGNTTPVFGHPEGVSPFGSFQQSGNLWEWCADAWDEKAYERYARGDFSPPTQNGNRVLRGGSWDFDDPRRFRGGNRSGELADGRLGRVYYGFRAGGSASL